MATTPTREEARRLARAIASDLLLYNDAAVRAGQPLGKEIADGRALFVERCGRDLLEVYEDAVAEMLPQSARAAGPAGGGAAYPRRTSTAEYLEVRGGSGPADLGAETRRARALVFAFGILLVAGAVWVWLFVRW